MLKVAYRIAGVCAVRRRCAPAQAVKLHNNYMILGKRFCQQRWFCHLARLNQLLTKIKQTKFGRIDCIRFVLIHHQFIRILPKQNYIRNQEFFDDDIIRHSREDDYFGICTITIYNSLLLAKFPSNPRKIIRNSGENVGKARFSASINRKFSRIQVYVENHLGKVASIFYVKFTFRNRENTRCIAYY